MKGRRKFLKGIGATTIASIGMTSAVSADRSNQDPYERSLELRQKGNWSNEKWRKYLTKMDIPHGYVQRTWTVPDQSSSSGPGTMGLVKSELTSTVTYTYPDYASYDIIDYEWDFNESWDDGGGVPKDHPSLAWDDDHYSPTSARDDWVYYGDYCMDPNTSGSKGPSGAVCAWNDADDDGDFASYFGCYVDRNWEDYTDDERYVYFDFVHSWSTGELSSVSIDSSGNVGVTYTTTTERWDIEDNATEAQLTDGESLG